VEEVRILGLILSLAISQEVATSDPFNSYLDSVKEHKATLGLASLATKCGFNLEGKHPIYAVSVGETWTLSPNLAKAVYDTESDFFSSAEVWTKDDKVRLMVLWSLSLDVGSEVRTMACINDDGRPLMLQVTNWSIPVDGKGQGWIHQQYEMLDRTGKVVLKEGHFEDAYGRKTAPPKLDEDDQGSFDWVPDTSIFLKIESDLFGATKVPKDKR
jgi:hypothetical protein